MIKRDAGQDGDRTHFYSQYWIDVALGKPTGAEAVATEPAAVEDDFDLEDVAPRALRPEPAPKPAKPAKTPEKKPEPAKLSSLADLANIDLLMKNSAEMGDDVAPDLASGYQAPDDIAPAFPMDEPLGDVEETEPEMESLEEYEADELEYDEDEEDDEWGGGQRGKKKPTQRRERRRDF